MQLKGRGGGCVEMVMAMAMVAPSEEEEVSSICNCTRSSPSSQSFSSALATKSSSSLADMEQRINLVAMRNDEDDIVGDSFAERAEFYYNKRPQLLALLQELYTAYTTLSDRYIQTVAKHHSHNHHRHSSVTSTLDSFDAAEDSGIGQIESDAESSLSYQQVSTKPAKNYTMVDNDAFVAELVIKNVEFNFLINEVSMLERQRGDSSRKIELQKSLLEVLESERLILLNENARLGYRVASLMEENKGIVAESVFMKRKASEMARCMLKLQDDHRVYLLNQKIEDLQSQIYGLEKRNKAMVESRISSNCKHNDQNGNGVTLEACFQIGKRKTKRVDSGVNSDKISKSGSKTYSYRWWAKVKNMDMFLCGHSINPTL